MLGFISSWESKLRAVWPSCLLDLPPNLLLVFVRDSYLLPPANHLWHHTPGVSPLSEPVPSSVTSAGLGCTFGFSCCLLLLCMPCITWIILVFFQWTSNVRCQLCSVAPFCSSILLKTPVDNWWFYVRSPAVRQSSFDPPWLLMSCGAGWKTNVFSGLFEMFSCCAYSLWWFGH